MHMVGCDPVLISYEVFYLIAHLDRLTTAVSDIGISIGKTTLEPDGVEGGDSTQLFEGGTPKDYGLEICSLGQAPRGGRYPRTTGVPVY